MSFKLLNSQLSHQDFESLLSGSTLTTILIMGDFIYSANVGDSKAMLVKKKKKSSSYNFGVFEGDPFQLTVDHRPNDYIEKQRIERNGGVVKQAGTLKPNGIFRVWLKDKDFPGLAMSRSIGDKLAHSVGVTSIPGESHR